MVVEEQVDPKIRKQDNVQIIYEKNVEVSDFEEVSREYDLDNEKLQSEHEMLQHFKVKLTVYVFKHV